MLFKAFYILCMACHCCSMLFQWFSTCLFILSFVICQCFSILFNAFISMLFKSFLVLLQGFSLTELRLKGSYRLETYRFGLLEFRGSPASDWSRVLVQNAFKSFSNRVPQIGSSNWFQLAFKSGSPNRAFTLLLTCFQIASSRIPQIGHSNCFQSVLQSLSTCSQMKFKLSSKCFFLRFLLSP